MTRAIPHLFTRARRRDPRPDQASRRPFRTVGALTVAALTMSTAAAVQVQAAPTPTFDLFALLTALLTPPPIAISAQAPPAPAEPPPPAPVDESFMLPVEGEFLSGFGGRSDGWHSGIDLRGRTGDPIHASKRGTLLGGGCGTGYGVCSMIDHGNGVTTLYAHMSRKEIRSGPVERGQVIGYVGCTGSCETPHVHFEVRQDDVRMDPQGYL